MSFEEAVEFFKAADTDGSGYLSYEELSVVLKKAGYGEKDVQVKSCTWY